MENLVNVLPVTGSIPFPDFVSAARNAGLRPELWLKAKQRGMLYTGFVNGVLHVSREPFIQAEAQ